VEFKKLGEVKIDRGVVFSNELLDAFPVHRVTRQAKGLHEFYVNVGEDGNFEWLLGGPCVDSSRLLKYFEDCGIELREGQVLEVNLEIEEWLRKVTERMSQGYVVTVDYGYAAEDLNLSRTNHSGTLRGFRRHQFVDDLLAQPGEQDLTATVNWRVVRSAGARLGLEVVDFERQDRFLLANGFVEQLDFESRQCKDDSERLRMTTAAREMILPEGMASHFQVLVQKKTS
jgi:SAM-dependent MidA family methyltransferase